PSRRRRTWSGAVCPGISRPDLSRRECRNPRSVTWGFHLERVTGIEPALSAWEAEVLPLNYTRVRVRGACALEAGTSGTPRRPGERRPAYLLSPGRANRRGPGRATAMPRAEPTATHEPRPAPHRPDAAAPYRTGPPVAPGGRPARLGAVLLSDRDIRAQVDAGRVGLEPFDAQMIQPASVDVRLDRYFRLFDNHKYAM